MSLWTTFSGRRFATGSMNGGSWPTWRPGPPSRPSSGKDRRPTERGDETCARTGRLHLGMTTGTKRSRQELVVPELPPELDRRFEAFVLDWDGTAVPDRRAAASGIRAAVERLCALGADVAVITGTHIGNVDPQLGARPAGPGRLFLCLTRGSEVYRVDADGPKLVQRRQATPEEDASLDAAAAEVVARLAEKGLHTEIVSQRLNRRKIDLIPEPEWADPPKARIDELLGAVERRLAPAGLSLRTVVELALEAARDAGLTDPKVTSDAKHAEIGLTDKADSSRWMFEEVWRRGIGPGLVLIGGDGCIGSNGPPLWTHPAAEPRVLAAGVYIGTGPEATLVEAPVWQQVDGHALPSGRLERTLDLRTGVLRQMLANDHGNAEAALFSSLAHPGTVAFRLAGPDALLPAKEEPTARSVEGTPGGVATAHATRHGSDNPARVERLGVYLTETERVPQPDEAAAALEAADRLGFETLLTEHRAAWADRWECADVVVDGDAELTRAVRFALFTLMASVRDDGEAAVGARGVSGPGYRGHVFWDTDVFVLPFLAATHPPAARAILEYRLRRLPAARTAARELQRAGARFPWESAATGEDVTPRSAPLPDGQVVPIRTGELEEHITADVAWAAACYLDWSGDASFETN